MRFIHTILPLCLASSLLWGAQGVAYLNQNVTLSASSDGSKPTGELIVATSVRELGTQGEFAEVEFLGYQPQGSQLVYERMGVLMVGYEIIDPASIQAIEEKKDEYGNVWVSAKAKGWIPKKALTSEKKSVITAGKNLFMERCGSCHALHSEDEFDANVWPNIVEGMCEQAGLGKGEKDLIIKYLQNAR